MINKALDFSHAWKNFEGSKESIRSDRRKRMQHSVANINSPLNHILQNFANFKIRILILTKHSGPKMTKSKPRGDGPKFIVHMKEGHIVISKHKIFFQSVERIF